MSKKQDPQRQKKKKWPWILAGVAVIVVAIVLLFMLLTSPAAPDARSVTVTRGNIVKTVVSTGNLDYGTETKVEVPSGIKVLEVKAKRGDTVSAGDVLATIDPLSLSECIQSKKGKIESIDRSIESSYGTTDSASVLTDVTGRVKRIYAGKGDSVSAIMREHGALMLLSFDGLMAVDIATEQSLGIGTSVKVTLENGSVVSGKVEKATADGYSITMTDYGPRLDEQVSVAGTDGTALGDGSLYIHCPIEIIGTSGTVNAVYGSENNMVYSGYAVFALKDLPPTAEYQRQLSDREKLVDELSGLYALAEGNAVIAEVDGIVHNVNISEGQTTSASGTDEDRMTALTLYSSDQAKLLVEIDELDILSVAEGQAVTVAFDAMPDRRFEGTITSIAAFPVEANGSGGGSSGGASSGAGSSGGAAKYKAEITLTRDESMRVGMGATATIEVGRQDGVLTVPLDAIQESNGRMFVYTQADDGGKELSGEVEVVTGISDGVTVEVTSGLNEGDTVFYLLKKGDTATMSIGPGDSGSGSGESGSSNDAVAPALGGF